MAKKKKIEEDIKQENTTEQLPKIVMGLDISTTCIGVCILEDDGSEYGKVLELTHISPKVPRKIKGIKSLFLKKQIFKDEFLTKWKKFGITKVVIEAPLLSSNNVNTVATLLQFNGMISDCVYEILGVVPDYITSYDARKYAFPSLSTIRKYNRNGEVYDNKKILSSIKNSKVVLFGGFMFDVDKKEIILSKVSEIFPNINWIYDKKGSLIKENFDATDAYVACIGQLHFEKHGELKFNIKNINIKENIVEYNLYYWDKTELRQTYLNEESKDI